MHRVFVIGAPSGTGKTTLLRLLIERVEGLRFSISHTTRAMRSGEVDGRDYHFVDRQRFAAEIAADGFLEWAEVYGSLYGTHRDRVTEAHAASCDLLLDVDVQGARAIRQSLPEAVLILILPPSWEVMRKRLLARGSESKEIMAMRLARTREQLAGYTLYDYAVVNDELEPASRRLEAIIVAERQRLTSRVDDIRTLLQTAPSG